MTLFHQNTPQLQNQLKIFPVWSNEPQLSMNSTQIDIGTFRSYEEVLDDISLIAFLPILVVGILLAVLFFLFKMRSLRSNRGQIDRLEEIYQILETVDRVAADPYTKDGKLIEEIRYALVSTDGDSIYFRRRDSLFPSQDDTAPQHPNRYYIHMATTENEIIRLKDEKNEQEDDQVV